MRRIGGHEQRGILEAGMKHTIIRAWILVLATSSALAQEPAEPVATPVTASAPGTEDWPALRAQVGAMRAQAQQMRAEAKAEHEAAGKTCWEKILVSSCLKDAKMTLREKEREAKRIEVEAGNLDRRIQAHEREVRAQRRIDEAPQRAAESAKRAEQFQLRQVEAEQRKTDKEADIERRQQRSR